MRIPALLSLPVLGLLLTIAAPASAQETNFSSGPQYLSIQGSPLFARPISTPSLSLETSLVQPADHTGSEAEVEQSVEDELKRLPPLDFYSIYYSPPRVDEIVISSHDTGAASTTVQIPASIFNSGVTLAMDPQTLFPGGSISDLAEAAAQAKARRSSPLRIYTNRDIERLRQGS